MSQRGHVGWSPDFKSTGAAHLAADRLRVIPPNPDGGLFAPVPVTPAQERAAFMAFLSALAKGCKACGPEKLWDLLGYNVEDGYLSDEDAAMSCAEVTALLRDVHEAGGPEFELPPPFTAEVDA